MLLPVVGAIDRVAIERGWAGVPAGVADSLAYVVKVKESFTGQYLKPVLARRAKAVGKKQAAE